MSDKINLVWQPLTSLDKESIDQIDNNKSGVYRLSFSPDAKNYFVFFVGKSEDLKKELLSFISDNPAKSPCILNHLASSKCKFRYAIIDDAETRIAAERQVYKFYQPSCNEPIISINENIIINVT